MKNLYVENEHEFFILKRNVHSIISRLKKELNFSITFLQINFVGAEQIASINEKYLNHKGSTDIITFNYSDNTFNLDGECYICIPVAEENARKFGVSLQNELLRLIVHGILHLLGFDDIKKSDKQKMKAEEDRLVKLLFNNDVKVIKE